MTRADSDAFAGRIEEHFENDGYGLGAHFPVGHPLRPAVLHRLSRRQWADNR